MLRLHNLCNYAFFLTWLQFVYNSEFFCLKDLFNEFGCLAAFESGFEISFLFIKAYCVLYTSI